MNPETASDWPPSPAALVLFDPSEERIAEYRAEIEPVVAIAADFLRITDAVTMDERNLQRVKETKRELVRMRNQIDKARLRMNADAQNYIRTVNDKAKKFTRLITAPEEVLGAALEKIEKAEREAAEAKVREQERIEREAREAREREENERRDAERRREEAERQAERAKLAAEREQLAKERAELEAAKAELRKAEEVEEPRSISFSFAPAENSKPLPWSAIGYFIATMLDLNEGTARAKLPDGTIATVESIGEDDVGPILILKGGAA